MMEPLVREQTTSEERYPGKGLVYSVICALMLLHLSIVISTTVNVPYWDDYDVFLRFLTEWRDSDSWSERVTLLTKQHNEHRLPAPRLTALALLSLWGSIDFRVLVLFSHLALFCALLLLAKEAIPRSRAFLVLAMLIMILPVQEESTIWVTGVLSNHLVLVYAILAFALATSPSTVGGILAGVVALVGIGSQANGLFILPVCTVVTYLTKKKIRSSSYLIATAVTWSLYFTSYSKVPNHCSLSHALQHPLEGIRYGLNFLGTSISLRYEAVSLLAGSAVVTVFLLGCYKRLYRTHPILFSLFTFLLITGAANTAGRLCFGPSYPLDTDGRYAIYSLTALGCSLLTVGATLDRWALPVMRSLTVLLPLLFAAAAFKYLPHLKDFSDRLETGVLRSHLTQDGTGMMYPNATLAYKYFKEAGQHGLYRPSIEGDYWRIATATEEPNRSLTTQRVCALDPIVIGDKGALLTGWTKRRGVFDELLIRIKGGDASHVIYPESVMRMDAIAALALPRHLQAGFAALIPEALLRPTSTLELILKRGDGSYEVCKQRLLYPSRNTVEARIAGG